MVHYLFTKECEINGIISSIRKEQKKQIINSITVVAGTFILAIAVETFIIPYRILSGGVAGIAVALQPLLHVSATLIANSVLIILLIIGGFILGKEFLKNTVLSCIAYPIFTSILNGRVNVVVDPILASIYGGLIAGAGVGIVLKTGASTGGMDIPALLIHNYTHISSGNSVMIVDALTVLLGMTTYGVEPALIGVLSVFTSGFAIDKTILIGSSTAINCMVISDKWFEIKSHVLNNMERGVTILEGKGGYTNESKPVLMIVIPQKLREYAGIDREVVMIGHTDTVAIWDKAAWDKINSPEEIDLKEIAEIGELFNI